MSFSVYQDYSLNSAGTRITVSSNVHDNSSGCNHDSYNTNVNINSPTGRSGSNYSSGLYASLSFDIADEYGDYETYTYGDYHCSCAMSTAGFGGPTTFIAIGRSVAAWGQPTDLGSECAYYLRQPCSLACMPAEPMIGPKPGPICPSYAETKRTWMRVNGNYICSPAGAGPSFVLSPPTCRDEGFP